MCVKKGGGGGLGEVGKINGFIFFPLLIVLDAQSICARRAYFTFDFALKKEQENSSVVVVVQ